MDAETLLLIKTCAARLGAVEARVAKLHPDELPEVVAVHLCDGSQDYLQWLKQETTPR